MAHENVYHWPGSPAIDLWRTDVTHNDRSWPQDSLSVQNGLPGAVVIAESNSGIVLIKHWRPVIRKT
jgi:hypothetical protein